MKKTSIISTLIIFVLISSLQLNAQSESSINFNGSGGKVTVPGSVPGSITEGSWGAWVKFDAFGSTYQRIIYKQSNIELFLYNPLKRFEAEIVVNNVRHEVFTDSSTFNIDTAQWYHVMVTYDTTDFKIYVDGDLKATNSTPQGPITGQFGNWGIGASPTSSSSSFSGEIDEVTLFNRALNISEIQSLICQQIDVSDAIYADLVAYYKFDENSGITTTDEVNANDGTLLTGANWTTQGMPNFKPQILMSGNTLSSNITGISYQWYLNGNALPNDTNISITPQTSGNYQVEVLSDFGCLGMSDIEAVVVTGLDYVINSNNQLIYPNPSNGIVSFTETKNIASVNFIDVMGKTVYTTSNTALIDISQLNSGMYFVKIICRDNSESMHKLYLE
jgi:hypothetical protein